MRPTYILQGQTLSVIGTFWLLCHDCNLMHIQKSWSDKLCLAKADTQLNDLHTWTTSNDTEPFYIFKNRIIGLLGFLIWLLPILSSLFFLFFSSLDLGSLGIGDMEAAVIDYYSAFSEREIPFIPSSWTRQEKKKRLPHKIRTTQNPSIYLFLTSGTSDLL